MRNYLLQYFSKQNNATKAPQLSKLSKTSRRVAGVFSAIALGLGNQLLLPQAAQSQLVTPGVGISVPSFFNNDDGCTLGGNPDSGDTVTISTNLRNNTNSDRAFRVVFRVRSSRGGTTANLPIDLLYGGPTRMSTTASSPTWDDSYGQVTNTPIIANGGNYTVRSNFGLLPQQLVNAANLTSGTAANLEVVAEVFNSDYSLYYGSQPATLTITYRARNSCPTGSITSSSPFLLTTNKPIYAAADSITIEQSTIGANDSTIKLPSWGDGTSDIVEIIQLDVPPTGNPETDYSNNSARPPVRTFNTWTAFNTATTSFTTDEDLVATFNYSRLVGSIQAFTNHTSFDANTLATNKYYLVRVRPRLSSVGGTNLNAGTSSHPLQRAQWTYFAVGTPAPIGAPQADVVTTKTGPVTAVAGTTVTYNLSTKNNGPDTATNVIISDNIGTGLTNIVVSNGGTYNSTTGIVTFPAIASLANGATQANTISFTAPASGSVTDVVSSTATTSDPTPANNNGSAVEAKVTTTITPSADVVTTKAGPATVVAGSNITYTITTTNNGPSTATNVAIKDTLPSGVTFVSASDSGTVASGVVSWPTIVSIASKTSVTRTVTVTAPANGGSIVNKASSTAATSDPNSTNNDGTQATAQASTTVTPSADLSIVKTDNQTTATPGSPISYTLTVTNNGPSTLNSVTVTDTVPPTILNPTFTPSTGTYNSSTGAWTGLTLAPGQSIALTLNGTVSPTATGSLTNTATVAVPTGVTDSVTSNNSSTDTDTLTPSADLSITKTDGKSSIDPGSANSYTITVTNNGPSTVNSVTVTDAVPSTIQNPIFTASSGTYNSTTGAWTGLNLATGQSYTLTLSGTVSATATGTINNTATVAAPTGVTDSVSNNNSSTDSTVVNPKADLSIVKTDGRTTINPGSAITYTITVTNNGPSSLSSLTVTDTVPSSIQNPVFTPSSGTYNSTTGVWAGVTLNSGQSITLTLSGTVSSTATGTITNTATVATPTGVGDPTLANNSSTDTTSIAPAADLSITKTAPNAVVVGSNVTYTLTVTNNGSSTATGVVVTDQLPQGVTYVSATPLLNCSQANGTVTCNLGSLVSGASSTISIVVLPTTTGALTNTANVAGNEFDPITTNNSATVTTSINADNPSQLLVVKRITAIVPSNGTNTKVFVDDPNTTSDNAANWSPGYLQGVIDGAKVMPGDEVEYTIYFLSNGGRSAQNVNMCDLIPANSTFLPNTFAEGSGIARATGSNAIENLTNSGTDADGGQFLRAGSLPPQGVSCSALNINGAVVFSLGNIPNATAPGTPNNAYGFIRFRVKVN